jgi:hypothetical protein
LQEYMRRFSSVMVVSPDDIAVVLASP